MDAPGMRGSRKARRQNGARAQSQCWKVYCESGDTTSKKLRTHSKK